jgi:hypothetical protein
MDEQSWKRQQQQRVLKTQFMQIGGSGQSYSLTRLVRSTL